ncbi:hypothetical protein PPYR_03694 [Photinus pyralis]|uniref:Uncharacterized protein n=1 Tax=Photinus pyralis TaxID=7054 RepID=A0A5N4A3H5_PHOPY|nr:hypothetical protein PPYR_03694 [Photinus pyralis]
MYIKTLLITLLLVHAVLARLRCYKCNSSKGHTNCQSGSGVYNGTCPEPPQDVGQTCLEYSENVNGATKYVRKCAIVFWDWVDKKFIPVCSSMKKEGRDILTCFTCTTDHCNGTHL